MCRVLCGTFRGISPTLPSQGIRISQPPIMFKNTRNIQSFCVRYPAGYWICGNGYSGLKKNGFPTKYVPVAGR